jgi:hypothetical protein
VDVNNADTFYKDFTELSVMDPCSRPETIKCGITGNTNCTLFTVKCVTDINNMAFYISGPKLLFETTEISTQQESNYIY